MLHNKFYALFYSLLDLIEGLNQIYSRSEKNKTKQNQKQTKKNKKKQQQQQQTNKTKQKNHNMDWHCTLEVHFVILMWYFYDIVQ